MARRLLSFLSHGRRALSLVLWNEEEELISPVVCIAQTCFSLSLCPWEYHIPGSLDINIGAHWSERQVRYRRLCLVIAALGHRYRYRRI